MCHWRWAWALMLLIVGGAAVRPAGAQCLPLSAGNADGNYIVPGVRGGIVYRRVDGRALALDAYVQRRGTRRPAVVIVHGGGWNTGSRVAFTGQFQELLARAGYNWFAIDYRLNGLARYQDAVDDLAAAVSFVRCHAADFRIDPENIVLFGEDAGAQVALMLAGGNVRGVRGVVSIGGFYDLGSLSGLTLQYPGELLQRASPRASDLSGMPPVMVVHGGDDREVPSAQAEAFCTALRSAGRACALTVVAGAIHRAENWWPSQWNYKTPLVEWLASTTGLAVVDHASYDTRLLKDIVFDAARGLAMDAFTPAGPGPFPAVIIAHGGGWEAGDKVTYVTPLFEPLARAGFAWFSIDYRMTPAFRNRDQVDDLRTAVRFVRQHATRWNVDPRRIAILGESASGQMVATLAAEKPDGVSAVVSFYGVYDFLQMAAAITPRSVPTRLFGVTEMTDATRELLTRSSPIAQAQSGMPPMLLVQGTADRLHAQAVAYGDRLASLGVPFQRYDVSGAPHGVENWEGHEAWLAYKRVLVEWLTNTLAHRR